MVAHTCRSNYSETEVRGSLESGRSGLQWTEIKPLLSSLDHGVRPCLKKNTKKSKTTTKKTCYSQVMTYFLATI